MLHLASAPKVCAARGRVRAPGWGIQARKVEGRSEREVGLCRRDSGRFRGLATRASGSQIESINDGWIADGGERWLLSSARTVGQDSAGMYV